jgi:hypothetical protein
MQIRSCEKRNSGDSVNRGRGEISQFEDTQVEEWDIVVSEAGASSSWIIKHAPLPNFNSQHPDNANLRCTGEYQIRRVDGSPIHFQATVTYEGPPAGATELPPGEDGEKKTKPEEREREPYAEEWSTVETEEPIDIDINGDPICTVAGEQFDPPLTETFYDVQFVESFNKNDFQQALQDSVGRVNQNAWKVYQPGQALLKSVNQKYFHDPKTGDNYWRITNTVLIRVQKANDVEWLEVWDKRIRAEGYLAKNSDGQVVRCRKTKEQTDAAAPGAVNDGTESEVPKLHDPITGRQIDDPTQAQWYTFFTKFTTDFQALKIG